jgi:hypothetical protein
VSSRAGLGEVDRVGEQLVVDDIGLSLFEASIASIRPELSHLVLNCAERGAQDTGHVAQSGL